MRIIFDLESNGLLDTITKIHCLCYFDYDTKESYSLTSYQDIIDLFSQDDLTVIGHNICRFDIPALEKILGIKIKARIIDTLPISWYLFPGRDHHGLGSWGEDFGVPKPIIEHWTKPDDVSEHEFMSMMLMRCEEDVKINTLLFQLQLEKLQKIYDTGGIDRILGYLTFKMQCAAEQEDMRWKLDVEKAKATLFSLEKEKENKFNNLIAAMPRRIKYGFVSKPDKMEIKDGSVSVAGAKWYHLLGQRRLPIDHSEPVQIEILNEPGNPNSPLQLKDWLFGLGWVPIEFKYVKEEQPDGRTKNRPIPQINTQDDGMCPSIKLLFDKEPKLENLESLFVISHRIGLLKGWLENVSEDGYLKAEVAGLTNTLRFIHKTLVNIPTIHKPYGKELRGCLIAPDDDHLLCGSDCSGLEDSTKHHYMYPYDKEYVEEQRRPGYDPHLSVAVAGDMASNHEEMFFKWYKSKDKSTYPAEVTGSLSAKGVTGLRFIELTSLSPEEQEEIIGKITKVRWGAKRVNFGAVYGAGIPKLMLTSGMDKQTTTILYNGYWKKNWSVKKIAKNTYHKIIDGQMWLWNPVSQFWYSLRYEKDKFSTLNQSTGVYCFDTWVRNVRRKGIRICGQFHDEIVFPLLKGTEEGNKAKLYKSMEEANDELKLNIKLGISVDIGESYAGIH